MVKRLEDQLDLNPAVLRLLTLKPNVNFRDTDGITPLQAACQVGMDG